MVLALIEGEPDTQRRLGALSTGMTQYAGLPLAEGDPGVTSRPRGGLKGTKALQRHDLLDQGLHVKGHSVRILLPSGATNDKVCSESVPTPTAARQRESNRSVPTAS